MFLWRLLAGLLVWRRKLYYNFWLLLLIHEYGLSRSEGVKVRRISHSPCRFVIHNAVFGSLFQIRVTFMLIAWLTGVAKKVDPRLWQFCRQRWGRNCKQAQERTSPNLGPSLFATPVHIWWRWCLFCKGHHIAGRLMSSFHVGCQYSIRCNDDLDRQHGRNKHEENEISILHHLLLLTHLTYRLISYGTIHGVCLVQLLCLWNRYKTCKELHSTLLEFQRYEMCHSPL